MRKTLTIWHSYPVDPDRLFQFSTDLDVLDQMTRPWLHLDHLPSGRIHKGQVINIAMSVFGILPGRPYTMRVVTCDPETRVVETRESGFGIRSVIHKITVEPAADGSKMCDCIGIDAGWRTPFVVLATRLLFRWRHRLRVRLLRHGA